jgi:hypothetical protein
MFWQPEARHFPHAARHAIVAALAILGLSAVSVTPVVAVQATAVTPSDCINDDDIFCNGFDPVPTVMPGTSPAAIGAPSNFAFNGLGLVTDALHHGPKHAMAAHWGAPPAPLAADNLSSIPNVTTLNRRDALVVYVPNVQGAADYRAYIYDANKVSYTSTNSGTQPRDAVIACAGFRQRYTRGWDATYGAFAGMPGIQPVSHRELLQEIEVPGLLTDGVYKIVIEALASPCPFTGTPAHTAATIPIWWEYNVDGDNQMLDYRSFDDARTLYGNEILNGQGSTLLDYKAVHSSSCAPSGPSCVPNHSAPAEALGRAVPPNDATFPADPVVLARSVIAVTRPAADEAQNAPLFDVGSNAAWDDFNAPIDGSSEAIMTSLHHETRLEGAGAVGGGQFGDEYYWSYGAQLADTDTSSDNPLGVQVWQRHGRRYTTFSDFGQDIWANVEFASTKTKPLQLDKSNTKYLHSFWRVNSGAAQRRYWTWELCGAATRAELADPVTNIPAPHFRVTGQPFYFSQDGGNNPSAQRLEASPDPNYHAKECLGLLQIGAYWYWGPPPNHDPTTWIDEPHSELRAFIHPAALDVGVINLKPANMGDGDGGSDANPPDHGMLWRLDPNRHPTRPMFEPFDQDGVLTHYDAFVRPDRIVLFINGRQAFCADLSDHPLTMNYAMPVYGNVLYHSTADIPTSYVGLENYAGAAGGSFNYVMNTPWTTTGIWDAIGQSELIDIPPQFASFDANACIKPASWMVRGDGF